MNRKIGERFAYQGNEYEVKKCPQWHSCQGCAFQDRQHPSERCYRTDLLAHTGECNGLVRDDKTYVCFAKVKP